MKPEKLLTAEIAEESRGEREGKTESNWVGKASARLASPFANRALLS
jgi:hypothetical protein